MTLGVARRVTHGPRTLPASTGEGLASHIFFFLVL